MEKKVYQMYYKGARQEDFCKAIVVGNLVFLSGMSGRDVETGEVKALDVKVQTRTAWEKIKSNLETAGASLKDIVKLTIYMRDTQYYPDYWEETHKFFQDNAPELLENPPCVTLVEAGLYRKNMLVEIDAWAILP